MAKNDVTVKHVVLTLCLVAALACNIRVHHEQTIIKNAKIELDTCQSSQK